MGLFRRRKQKPGVVRRASAEDFAHLEEFARTRRGVEAYVEPRTTVTEMTVALVAHDGEWTRRRVDGPEAARELGQRLSIPVYDVGAVGYPRRMREWTSRQKAGGADRDRPSG
ncbi:MAG TPA: oxidoreductase [Mycobacteriales bacterium]